MSGFSRRGFLKTSTSAGASLLLMGTRASGMIRGANDRLRVAIAGLNGRGQGHISGWLEQQMWKSHGSSTRMKRSWPMPSTPMMESSNPHRPLPTFVEP